MKHEKQTANEPEELVPFLHGCAVSRHVSRRNRVEGARGGDREAPDQPSPHTRHKGSLGPLVTEIAMPARGRLKGDSHAEPVVQASGDETRGPRGEFTHCWPTWVQWAHGSRLVCTSLQILFETKSSEKLAGRDRPVVGETAVGATGVAA